MCVAVNVLSDLYERYIDIGEYALLARTLGIPKNSNFMSFEVMDADNSGTISYNEFLQTLLNYVENYDKFVDSFHCFFCLPLIRCVFLKPISRLLWYFLCPTSRQK